MATTLIAHGVLRPDGWIELLDPTGLPSEPIEVDISVTVLKPTTTNSVPPTKPWTREPGGFWPDESISAPFDLPRPGIPHLVTARPATKPRLPDPIFLSVDEEPVE